MKSALLKLLRGTHHMLMLTIVCFVICIRRKLRHVLNIWCYVEFLTDIPENLCVFINVFTYVLVISSYYLDLVIYLTKYILEHLGK